MEKEKRYSYIRKQLAKGTVGACILSGLALFLFIGYSFYRKGAAGIPVSALAFLSVDLAAFSLSLTLPAERGEFIERRPLYCVRTVDILLLFVWLFFLFLGIRAYIL